jgi:glycopeptide antibiotics resistance protein
VSCSAFGLATAKIMRPFVNGENVFLDSAPNFFSASLFCLIFFTIYPNSKHPLEKATLLSVVLHLLYELIQFVLPYLTFDVNDLIATVLGGITMYLLGKLSGI